jgi:hypothetical protein
MNYARRSLDIDSEEQSIPVSLKLGEDLMDYEKIPPAN